ncbi:MAG: hypothetical protein Q8P11_00150 [bacterium]|nr:hypothetical protein [bacterium]
MAEKTKKTTSEILEPFLIVGVFAIVIYFGYVLLFQQLLEQLLPGGTSNAETLQQQLLDRKAYFTSLTRLEALYQDSQKDTTKQIEVLVPAGQGIPQIFASYEALAGRFDVKIQSIDVVSDKKVSKSSNGGLQSLLVSMKVANADYTSVKDFLDAIEKNIRIADVQSISFDPRSRFIDITLRSYYRTISTGTKQ